MPLNLYALSMPMPPRAASQMERDAVWQSLVDQAGDMSVREIAEMLMDQYDDAGIIEEYRFLTENEDDD